MNIRRNLHVRQFRTKQTHPHLQCDLRPTELTRERQSAENISLGQVSSRLRPDPRGNAVIVMFCCSSYADANVQQLKALVLNYDDQRERFRRIKKSQDLAFARLEIGSVEEILRPSPDR